MEHPVQIDRHDVTPQFGSDLREGHPRRRAGIVDEDCDRPLRLAGEGEGTVDLIAHRDVGGRDQRVEIGGGDLLQPVAAAADEGELRPLRAERSGDGRADAGAAAGDDCVVAF
jgi:hypothetical protein